MQNGLGYVILASGVAMNITPHGQAAEEQKILNIQTSLAGEQSQKVHIEKADELLRGLKERCREVYARCNSMPYCHVTGSYTPVLTREGIHVLDQDIFPTVRMLLLELRFIDHDDIYPVIRTLSEILDCLDQEQEKLGRKGYTGKERSYGERCCFFLAELNIFVFPQLSDLLDGILKAS